MLPVRVGQALGLRRESLHRGPPRPRAQHRGVDEHQGIPPDEIVSHIPTITLANVQAALANYFDHIEEIQQEMCADLRLRKSYAAGATPWSRSTDFFTRLPDRAQAGLSRGRSLDTGLLRIA